MLHTRFLAAVAAVLATGSAAASAQPRPQVPSSRTTADKPFTPEAVE